MVTYPPYNRKKEVTEVYTAGRDQPPELAMSSGTIKVGNLEGEALEVPSFSKNLVSATQLSMEHGCKQVISPWTGELTISKDDKVVATGAYDPDTKLIKINNYEFANVLDWKTVHRYLGHASDKMMKKTIKLSKIRRV